MILLGVPVLGPHEGLVIRASMLTKDLGFYPVIRSGGPKVDLQCADGAADREARGPRAPRALLSV